MEHDDDFQQSREQRGNFLAFMLTGLALMGFLLFLILITGGFFIWVVLGVVGIAALAFLNWILWGRSMMQDTAGEREEEELRGRTELEDWELPEPRRPRHL